MKALGIVLIWFVLLGLRFNNGFQATRNLQRLTGSKVKLVGNISSEPTLQGRSQSFKIGRVKVTTSSYPEYDYGQKIVVSGTLEERVVNRFTSRFSLVYPDVRLVKSDSKSSMILELRRRMSAVFDQVLPEPEASLLAGVVLGIKRGLPKDFWLALQRTGTLHIIVASGFNVTVVIGTVIAYLAGLVRRRTAVILGLVAVMVYTLMAGAEPPIVRAAIMGSLAYFGQVLGKQTDGVRLLLVAAGVMLTFDPYLIWDIGFQLSFMATAGLIFISPLLTQVFKSVWLVGKDMSETTGAQIAVWPVLLISFGQLSAFSILVNSLILWLVPIIMGLGALLVLSGLIWLPLARVVGGIVYGPLTILVRLIEWFGGFDWMSWQVEGIGWWWGLGYYLVLGLIIFRFNRR